MAESKRYLQQDRESAYSMMAEIMQDMKEFGDVFKSYLHVQSRFHRYSVGNALLVAYQNPEATRLADFETWKSKGLHIQRGESGIILLEPGDEYQREDGTTGVSFNARKVFDESQTNSKYVNHGQRKADEREVITALSKDSRPYIQIDESVPEEIGAAYNKDDGKIYIRPGMDGEDIIRVLSRELAMKSLTENGKSENASFKAFCVSYMVCERVGVDTDKFKFDRLPDSFKGMEDKDFRSELSDIRDTAKDMIDSMNRNMEKEKNTKNRDDAR